VIKTLRYINGTSLVFYSEKRSIKHHVVTEIPNRTFLRYKRHS